MSPSIPGLPLSQAIRAVKDALRIPVVANGGVEQPEDIDRCLAITGADGVMSSEARGALMSARIQY